MTNHVKIDVFDNNGEQVTLALAPADAIRFATNLIDTTAAHLDIPDERLTALHRALNHLEILAAGKTVAEIAEQEEQRLKQLDTRGRGRANH